MASDLCYRGIMVNIGVSVVTKQIFVPITAVVRRQVDMGAGVVTVLGS